jgi:ParB-like chromosome segregation protein Spo0J
MKEELIPIQELRQHPDYIRGQHSKSYVEELATVIKDSGWVFPPVTLQPIPTADKAYIEGAKYWIVDGTHRVAAAFEVDPKGTVKANILQPMTGLDAIAMQIKLNNAHGLRLSLASQTNAIKKLSEHGMKGKLIAEKTGLTPASISRILSDKQRTTEKTTGKESPEGSTAKKTAKPFNVEAWMKSFARSLKAWEKYGAKIRKSGFPESLGKSMDTLAEKLLHAEE